MNLHREELAPLAGELTRTCGYIIACRERVGEMTPKRLVAATLRCSRKEVIMCTESNLQENNLLLCTCTAIITSLHLSHVTGDYLTSIMTWIPLFVYISPPIAKSFWHQRGAPGLMHQVSIGGHKRQWMISSHLQWFLGNNNVVKSQKTLENLRKRREDFLFALRVLSINHKIALFEPYGWGNPSLLSRQTYLPCLCSPSF